MSNVAISKITVGLDNRPTLDDVRPKMKAGAPTTKSQAVELALQSERMLGALKSVLDSNASHLKKTTQMYRDLIERTDSKTRRDEIQKISDSLEKEQREQLKSKTESSRYNALRALHEMEELANVSREYFENPVMMLTASNIGSERRDRIANQLANLGPAAVRSLMQQAVNNEDKELGAELIRHNDNLKANRRAFNSRELAQNLVGDEVKAATDLLMNVKRQMNDGITLNRSFESGKGENFTNKINNALEFANTPPLLEIE